MESIIFNHSNMPFFLQTQKRTIQLEILKHECFPSSTTDCAQFFLGKILFKGIIRYKHLISGVGGVIIETEAYTYNDPASHSYCGETRRNRAMFSEIGNLYVYQSYGIHHCVNIVTGKGSAVLLRSLFPLVGIERMRLRRNVYSSKLLCKGPGNICAAMGISMSQNMCPLYWNVWDGDLRYRTQNEGIFLFAPIFEKMTQDNILEEKQESISAIKESLRIGISKNTAVPWRYFLDIPGYISRSRVGHIIAKGHHCCNIE